ncbi:MAG: SBBP repeat-containing protein, partial [Cytophagaceae bacterium]
MNVKNQLLYLLFFLFSIPGYTFIQQDSLATKGEVAHQIDKLPVVFRENAGQWDEDILFRGASLGTNVYFLKDRLSFAHNRFRHDDGQAEYIVWNLNFENANKEVNVSAAGKARSRTNYLSSGNSSVNVPDYRELYYSNIYEKIDLRYYGYEQSLKYDYILKPGARISDIRMNCEGVDSLFFHSNGELEIFHKWGSVKENKPYSYQVIDGQKKEVDIRFIKYDDYTFGFKAHGAYNPNHELIIDPVTLRWSTYVGGTDPTRGGYLYDLTTDRNGFIYATGYYPASFPVTPGAYDNTYNGGVGDVYVFKLDQFGRFLIYATYIGGTGDDRGNGIAVNNQGEVFITGHTTSPHNSFPNTARIGNMTGGTNTFVCKLNTAGSQLVYSTYIGGLNHDKGNKIKVDNAGNAYVCGETSSTNFPVTGGSFRQLYGGGAYDGFVFKLNPAGNAMVYGTYIGGNNDDRCKALAVDQNNQVYITGYTNSANFTATINAYDNTHNGSMDAFVLKLNTEGSALIYSTFLGGAHAEEGSAIDVNQAGEAFVTGYTFSGNFPKTVQSTYKGLKDIFVTRFNAAGSRILYSRYIGGVKNDDATSIIVNIKNEAFLAGTTRSDDFPIVDSDVPEIDSSKDREDQVFILMLSADGETIKKSLKAGGSYDDYKVPSLSFPDRNIICDVTLGFTSHSPDLTTTENVFQDKKLNGNHDHDQPAVMTFYFGPKFFDTTKIGARYVCPGDIVTARGPEQVDPDYPLVYNWVGRGLRGEFSHRTQTLEALVDTLIFFGSPEQLSMIELFVTDGCNFWKDTLFIFLPVDPKIEIRTPDMLCDNEPIEIRTNRTGSRLSFLWSNADINSWTEVATSGTYWVRATDRCGQVASDTIEISQHFSPSFSLGGDRELCFPNTYNLIADAEDNNLPLTYEWSTGANSPGISISEGGDYWLEISNSCGTLRDDIFIEELFKPEIALGRDTAICDETSIVLSSGHPELPNRWSTGERSDKITVSETGTYWVEVTNVCGTSRDSIEVGRSEDAPVVDLGENITLCGALDLMLDAGNPGSNFYWSTGAETQTIQITSGGTYTVTVTNGCGMDSGTIEIIANPVLALNLPPFTKICIPEQVRLDAGRPGGQVSYSWSNGSNAQFINVSASGTYSVTVTNACGTQSASAEVDVETAPPTIDLGADISKCPSEEVLIEAGVNADAYEWSTGETTPDIWVTNAGTYVLTVSNSCGSSSDQVNVQNVPAMQLSLGSDRSVCAPALVHLDAGNPGAEYLWSTGSTSQRIEVA